jgi:hypothetical protein
MTRYQETALAEWLLNAEVVFESLASIFEEIATGTTITTDQSVRFGRSARAMEKQARDFRELVTKDLETPLVARSRRGDNPRD